MRFPAIAVRADIADFAFHSRKKSVLKRSRRQALSLEGLESRLVLNASIWNGSASGAWSNNANWNTPPVTGNDLTFPSSASNLINSNDLTTVNSFGSINVQAASYKISGAAVTLAGSIDASQSSGVAEIDLPLGFNNNPANVTVNNSGASLALGGVISNTTGLTKLGSGELDVTSTNAALTATASVGTLRVEGQTASLGPVVVSSGATFGGTGTAASIVSNSGVINPGTGIAPGTLTDTGLFTLSGASTYSVNLTSSSQYGQTIAEGAVTLTGATLDLTLAGGFNPALNTSFTLISNQSGAAVNGTFNNLPQGTTFAAGGQPFTITYTGGTSGHDVVITREAATSTTTASVSPTLSVFSQTVTLSATVAGSISGLPTPTGNVQFNSNGSLIGTSAVNTSGVATLQILSLPVGTNSITAIYQGNTNFATSTSAPQNALVSQADTTTTLTTSPNPSTIVASVTLSATVAIVAPGTQTPTGVVDFFNGNTALGTGTLTNGVATLTTTSLPVGTNALKADYQGSTNDLVSTSSVVNQTVNQTATTTTLTSSSTNVTPTGSLVLSAAVTANSGATTPTGSVTFVLNGSTTLGSATLANGQATFTATGLPTGSDSITAIYGGDSNSLSSASAPLTVNVGTSNQRIVEQLYLTIDHRSATSSELAFWSGKLDKGVPIKTVVSSLTRSQDAKVAAIQAAYMTYLGRSATNAELKSALGIEKTRGTTPTMQVLASEAFFKHSGGTLAGYFTALGEDLTGRPLGVVAQGYLASQLAAGKSRSYAVQSVLADFSRSNVQVTSNYHSVLGRAPDFRGLNYLRMPLNHGAAGKSIISKMLISKEFQSQFNG